LVGPIINRYGHPEILVVIVQKTQDLFELEVGNHIGVIPQYGFG